MYCCAECFGDRTLTREIIPLRSETTGDCSYCGTENTSVVAPGQISEFFEPLFSAYKRDDQGKVLAECLREDWEMFQHPRMDNARSGDLLATILNDPEIVTRTFSPAYEASGSPVDDWEKLRDELMCHNRFFPDANVDPEWLGRLLVFLAIKSNEVPGLWHRARIQSDEKPYAVDQMGAPPSKLAVSGRANPAGIPYLYLGSTLRTAICEIRPQVGEIACVAGFEIAADLELVDLRKPRRTVSPFQLDEGEQICKLRGDLPFLERLGEELTRPVLPRSAAIDYTPSQYLCEFIKKSEYQGVVYRSSVSDGINLALFNPKCAEIGSVTQHRVTSVLIGFEPYGA
jgi:hypothetical protein